MILTPRIPKERMMMEAHTSEHGTHARVGDEIVVGGPTVGKAGRDGEVVGLHHDDGTPPYDVRWSDTGRTTLFYPGPDAHIRHLGANHSD
ncbi:hypothetical protein SSAG_01297 [Streptomyces sp. Mg1]|nr:hypothetical protein SSAG_01297 [Streptomyces sp. Mg1]